MFEIKARWDYYIYWCPTFAFNTKNVNRYVNGGEQKACNYENY